MAAYISFQPTDYFNATIYSGDDSTDAISVGLQPSLTWIKRRNSSINHKIYDDVRGGTISISSNQPAAQITTDTDGYLNTFTSDGFTCQTGATSFEYVNQTGGTYVSWNWKAGTTTGIDTTGSTITPTGYSFNTTSGFSIVQYDGNGVQGATVPHGLGAAPEFIIVKSTDAVESWPVGHAYMNSSSPWDYYAYLNTTAAAASDSAYYADVSPTSTVFSVGNNSSINSASNTYIAYCFAPKKGYSKFGSYVGNGNADGTFVYTGFRPAYILLKHSHYTTDWYVFDNKRIGYNVDNNLLFPNLNAADNTGDYIDIVSNGFKIRSTDNGMNGSTNIYIYAAFAEFPLVSSNSKPGNAR